MAIALNILFGAFALALITLIVVIVTPVRVSVTARTTPATAAQVSLAVLGGLMPRFTVFDTARPSSPKRKKTTKKPRKKRRKPGVQMASAMPRLLRDLLRVIHVDYLRAHGEFGLSDPAATGAAFGGLAPLVYAVPYRSGSGITLRPNFSQTILSGQLDAALRFRPVALLAPLMRFGWQAYGRRK